MLEGHTENIDLIEGVTYYGSMSESFDSRDIFANPTTIESTTSSPVVVADSINTETRFDGFTIMGGVDSDSAVLLLL